MTRHIILSLAALFCSCAVLSAQGVSVVKVDYTRIENGEQIGAGSFIFAADGRTRHDRVDRHGELVMSHIWDAEGGQRIDVDHAMRTAIALGANMVRDSTGTVRVPAPRSRPPENGTEMLPLGPRAVGPLVLEGYRASIPARPGRPAMEMEMWAYRQPGHFWLHFLEQTTTSTNRDGSPLVDEQRIVFVQRVTTDNTVFEIPADVTIGRLPTRPRER